MNKCINWTKQMISNSKFIVRARKKYPNGRFIMPDDVKKYEKSMKIPSNKRIRHKYYYVKC